MSVENLTRCSPDTDVAGIPMCQRFRCMFQHVLCSAIPHVTGDVQTPVMCGVSTWAGYGVGPNRSTGQVGSGRPGRLAVTSGPAHQPWYAVPCRAASCRAVPCRAVSYRTVSCRAVPCRAVPCRVVPCRAVLCRAVASLPAATQP